MIAKLKTRLIKNQKLKLNRFLNLKFVNQLHNFFP